MSLRLRRLFAKWVRPRMRDDEGHDVYRPCIGFATVFGITNDGALVCPFANHLARGCGLCCNRPGASPLGCIPSYNTLEQVDRRSLP